MNRGARKRLAFFGRIGHSTENVKGLEGDKNGSITPSRFHTIGPCTGDRTGAKEIPLNKGRLPLFDLLLLLLLVVLQIPLTLLWLSQDHKHPYGDEITYYQMTHDYAEILKDIKPGFLSLLSNVHSFRPPLYPLVNSLVFPLFQGAFDLLVVSNSLYFGLIILVIYLMGRKFCGRGGALLAAFLFFAYPLFQEVSRSYLLETSLSALVSLSFFAYLCSGTFRKLIPSLAFGLFVGLGTLVKWTFPLFLLGLAACEGVRIGIPWLRGERRERPRSLKPLLNFAAFLFPALLISLLWYGGHLDDVSNFTLWNQEVRLWSKSDWLFEPSLFYLYTLPYFFHPPFALLFLAGLLFTLYRCVVLRDRVAVQLLVLFFGSVFCFSLLITKGGRHLLPAYPAAALVSLSFFQRIPKRRWKWLLACLIFLIGLGGIAHSLGGEKRGEDPGMVKKVLLYLYPHDCFPFREDWKVEAFLDAMEERMAPGAEEKLLQIPRVIPFDGLPYFIARRGLSLQVTGYSYYLQPGHKRHVHYDFQRLLDAHWILSKDGSQGGYPSGGVNQWMVNRYLLKTQKFLEEPSPAFQEAHERIASFSLPDRSTLSLWRRTKPVSLEEREEVLRFAAEVDYDNPQVYGELAEVCAGRGAERKAEGFGFLERGMKTFHEGEARAALPLLERGKLFLEDEIWGDYLCAAVKASLQDWEGVQGDLETAMGIEHCSFILPLLLARAYMELERGSLAVPLLKRLSSLDPSAPDPHHLLEEIYRKEGEEEKAFLEGQIKEKKISLMGSFQPSTHKVWFSLGTLLRRSGRADEAIGAFRKAAALGPDRGIYRIHLGDALHETGRPEEALEQYREALKANPKDFSWRKKVVDQCLFLGRVQSALEVAKEGLKYTENPAIQKRIEEFLEDQKKVPLPKKGASPGKGRK